MAQIRFVDVWLRAPGAPPSHYRSVMVITEKWAEQRVLMRAYAESRDQTRPTITLYGIELAIGPAGVDVNGAWGIHVGEQGDGAAQQVKGQLEDAARRLAGSKGNPPRLADEESTFEREPTANWGPGAPRVLPKRVDGGLPQVDFVQQPSAARIPQQQPVTYVPQHQIAAHHVPAPAPSAAPSNPELRKTPMPRQRTGKTRPPPMLDRTALGYQSGSGAQSAVVRLGLAPHVSSRLGWLVDRVVPQDFQIDSRERKVLNALGDHELTAKAIGQMLDVTDAMTFMEDLTRKLEGYGLDLVEPGNPHGGEPTYRLRR
ncbi:MAG: hypothetical protein IPQ07_09980 [Myxococcales bacterium]|jgi:hypothetical protein|nr:hypothetical protein [Myxococcales bacterium]